MVAAARPVRAQAEKRSTGSGEPGTGPSKPGTCSAQREGTYLNGLGTVTAYTVTIKSRVDGQLMSVSFKEGDLVQAGQIVATIDPQPYQVQLDQAEGQLARDQAQLADALIAMKGTPKAQRSSQFGSSRNSTQPSRAIRPTLTTRSSS